MRHNHPAGGYEKQWGIKNKEITTFFNLFLSFSISLYVLFPPERGFFHFGGCLFSYKGLNGGAKPALFPHNQGCAYEFLEGLFLFSGYDSG